MNGRAFYYEQFGFGFCIWFAPSPIAVWISLLLLGSWFGFGGWFDFFAFIRFVGLDFFTFIGIEGWVRVSNYPVAHSKNQIHSVLGAVPVPQRGTDYSSIQIPQDVEMKCDYNYSFRRETRFLERGSNAQQTHT